MKIVWLFFVTVLLAGCATLNREQCQRGDWYGVGMADGRAGEPSSRLDKHLRACSEYGVRIDEQQYRNGYADGLGDYCRIENAFETGLQGLRYQGICPPSIHADFERCNRAAYEVYRIRRELDRIEDEILSREYLLRDNDLSGDRRWQLRHDIRQLDWRHDRLRDDLYASERYLDQLRDEAHSRHAP